MVLRYRWVSMQSQASPARWRRIHRRFRPEHRRRAAL